MIAKKHLDVINANLNHYAVAEHMFNQAETQESRSLWAQHGIDALNALAVYGIKPDAGHQIRREQWEQSIKIAA